MKTTWLRATVCAAVAACVLAAPVSAEQPAGNDGTDKPRQSRADKPKAALRGKYAIMAAELKLDDAQKARLEQLVIAKEADVKAWKEQNQSRLDEARRQSEAARASKDKNAIASAKQQSNELNSQLKVIETKHDTQITAVLTPEQQKQWQGMEMFQGTMQKFSRADLTAEQKAQVKQRCLEASASMQKDEDGKVDPKAKQRLWAAIEKDVLTPEQREKMSSPREPKNPAGGPAEKKPAAEEATMG